MVDNSTVWALWPWPHALRSASRFRTCALAGAGCVYSGSIRLASAAATWPLGVVGVGIKRPAARHPVVGHAAMQGLFGLAFGLFVGRALGFLAPATVHH